VTLNELDHVSEQTVEQALLASANAGVDLGASGRPRLVVVFVQPAGLVLKARRTRPRADTGGTCSTNLPLSDGSLLLSSGADKEIRLWDSRTGVLLRAFQGHENRVNDALLTSDDATVVHEF
jgi:WD40 repeat protein